MVVVIGVRNMRRIDKYGKRLRYLKRRQILFRKKQNQTAARRKVRKFNRKRNRFGGPRDPLSLCQSLRSSCKKRLYKKVKYSDPPEIIEISGEFGLEHDMSEFLDAANSFMSLKSKHLFFDLTECEKIWPSAITLLCSLAQWVELTSHPNHKPRIGSSSSNQDKVTSYLNHCGFHDYVSRGKEEIQNYYSSDEIVKIRREFKATNIAPREIEIVNLLRKHSNLSEEEIEEFDCVLLSEIFNNVEEHGINSKDKGWWTLSQYHKTTGIISICIADNGIGVKNNLITGPQREEILKKLPENSNHDGDFIKLAVEENVSGAMNAAVKSGRIFSGFERGSRRGNGLARISETCKKLKIPLVILSHKGYFVSDKDGSSISEGAKSNSVFAGTLYHLRIPARSLENGKN